MNKKHIGSKFDDFLKEENLFEQVQAAAIKRLIAYQIATEMKNNKISKTHPLRYLRWSVQLLPWERN
jgi:antitoxin HicB